MVFRKRIQVNNQPLKTAGLSLALCGLLHIRDDPRCVPFAPPEADLLYNL
jgi:hypothetical protein